MLLTDDNTAILDGFTREIQAHHKHIITTLYLLIKPGTQLDGWFRAWDQSQQDFVTVDGSLYRIV